MKQGYLPEHIFKKVEQRQLSCLQAESALTFFLCNSFMHVSFMVLLTISLTTLYSLTSNSFQTSSAKFGLSLNSLKSNCENGGKVTASSVNSVMRHSRISFLRKALLGLLLLGP
uniref:Uncharacterized protein n=1 Tax=Rhipicephalus zambeziensis TaxID=60191 RepID=A0A224Y9F8_9ACAR